MSRADARGIVIVLLLSLVAAAVVLAQAPLGAATVRLAGISLTWWYAGVLVPLAAAALAATALVIARPAAVSSAVAWAGPLLLLVVATRVLRGGADAALLAVLVLVAPLVASLATSARPADPPPRLVALVTLVALALALGANLRILVDVAAIFGIPHGGAAAMVGTTVLLLGLASHDAVRPSVMAALGLTAVGVALAIVALAAGTAPWTAWQQIASRPEVTFAAARPAASEGVTVVVPTTVTFTEAHRVTALAPGVFRVSEHDGVPETTRDWRLAAGESVTLRAGDRLSLPSGAQVRFEAGKRVPGAAISGIAWADPSARQASPPLLHAVGLALAVVGGGLVLASPPAAVTSVGTVTAAAGPVAWMSVAVCWGLYAAYAAPDIVIGMPGAAGIVSLPHRALGGASGRVLTSLAAGGLLVLAVAGAASVRGIAAVAARGLASRTSAAAAPLTFVAVVLAATALGASALDPWSLLVLGLGVAAAAVAGPLLAAREARDAAIGSLVGAGLYGVTLVWGWRGVANPAAAVLVAMPSAWAVARLAASRGAQAPRRRR